MRRKTKKGISCQLYAAWTSMRYRCSPAIMSPKARKYYFGKGIRVNSVWDDYLKFREWSLHNGFSKGLSLDRIDSNGNYEPSNCQWITKSENFRKDIIGDKHHSRKLSEEKVRYIRSSPMRCKELAEKFNVTLGAISAVRLGKNWGHVI